MVGECHRRAPQTVAARMWPITDARDWCAELLKKDANG